MNDIEFRCKLERRNTWRKVVVLFLYGKVKISVGFIVLSNADKIDLTKEQTAAELKYLTVAHLTIFSTYVGSCEGTSTTFPAETVNDVSCSLRGRVPRWHRVHAAHIIV